MAADEYRVEVDIHESVHGKLSERLRSLDLDDEVQERLGDRVIVTRDGERLYVYAQSAQAAIEAERVVRDVLADEGIEAGVRRRRWNRSRCRLYSSCRCASPSKNSCHERRRRQILPP